jgi:hypothetical protein
VVYEENSCRIQSTRRNLRFVVAQPEKVVVDPRPRSYRRLSLQHSAKVGGELVVLVGTKCEVASGDDVADKLLGVNTGRTSAMYS